MCPPSRKHSRLFLFLQLWFDSRRPWQSVRLNGQGQAAGTALACIVCTVPGRSPGPGEQAQERWEVEPGEVDRQTGPCGHERRVCRQ